MNDSDDKSIIITNLYGMRTLYGLYPKKCNIGSKNFVFCERKAEVCKVKYK